MMSEASKEEPRSGGVTGRRCGCGEVLPDNPKVRSALELWDAVDHFGNLHIYVADGNLEDIWIHRGDAKGDYLTARESVLANQYGGANAVDQARELQLVEILETMNEAERFSAYGSCMTCVAEVQSLLDEG